jgi:hypothetical protein
MINSLVAIFVTVPIILLTGAGTILVTVYFNLQTQKIAVQEQRSALRGVRDIAISLRKKVPPKRKKWAKL